MSTFYVEGTRIDVQPQLARGRTHAFKTRLYWDKAGWDRSDWVEKTFSITDLREWCDEPTTPVKNLTPCAAMIAFASVHGIGKPGLSRIKLSSRPEHGSTFARRGGGGGANMVGNMGYYASGGMTSAERLARMVGPGPEGGGGAKAQAALDVVLRAFVKAHPFHKTHRLNAWIGRGPEAKRHVGCRSCDKSWVRKGNGFVEVNHHGGGGANLIPDPGGWSHGRL